MSTDLRRDTTVRQEGSTSPDDGFLISSMVGGDAAALHKLMDRYDRLVRYTIFRVAKERCTADPDWLDSVAGDTWTGFVESMRRDPDNSPRSLAAYLARTARNRAVSAVRRVARDVDALSLDTDDAGREVASTLDDPKETLERVELLGVLRECLHELESDDQALASQLEAITERRWRQASEALGISESTLRSRWKRTLAQLRRCVERKGVKTLAPPGPESDL